jgi:mono/diheme cytochrome c family protein
VGPIYSANLTSGKGGVGSKFKDADFIRAIRHGVDPDGKGLLVMPSTDYVNLSADDLGAVIAYVKSVPPVDNVVPEPAPGLLGRFLLVNGSLPLPSAAVINHTSPFVVKPPVAATVEYGKYIANIGCIGCHGNGLSGGPIPGMPPEAPPALNLTPAGEIAGWSDADFIKTLRTGVNPAGKQIREPMPWKNIGQLSDDELRAIYLYLKTVPAKPQGGR